MTCDAHGDAINSALSRQICPVRWCFHRLARNVQTTQNENRFKLKMNQKQGDTRMSADLVMVQESVKLALDAADAAADVTAEYNKVKKKTKSFWRG